MAAEHIAASVVVDAEPEEVYEYFTSADAMIQWMGQRASLEPQPGGEFAVDVEGTTVRGQYLELDPPFRLVFSWGFARMDSAATGASTVEVVLVPDHGGTRVEISHRGLSGHLAEQHRSGWRRFLGRLAVRAAGTTLPPAEPGS